MQNYRYFLGRCIDAWAVVAAVSPHIASTAAACCGGEGFRNTCGSVVVAIDVVAVVVAAADAAAATVAAVAM